MEQFSLRKFVKKGLLEGLQTSSIPHYKIRLDAASYHEKGVLTKEDLKEIQEAAEQMENGKK